VCSSDLDDKPESIHYGTPVGWNLDKLIGWKLVGPVVNAKLMTWDKKEELIADVLMPGEEKEVKIKATSPLTKLEEGNVTVRILSNNKVVDEEKTKLTINTPMAVVAGNYNKEDGTTDLYFAVNNKGNGQLKDVYIEFNLNEGSHTKLFELYGPYNVSANDIFIIADKYLLNNELGGKNYTIKMKVYSNLSKISESENILDLTEKEPSKTANNDLFGNILKMFE
jgi:hypothetical protein